MLLKEYVTKIIREEITPVITKALYAYIQNNQKGPLSRLAPSLLKMKDDPALKDILDPSGYSVAYRIMDMDRWNMTKLVGKKVEEMDEGVTGPGVLPSNGGISGWSVQPDMLAWISPNNGKGTHVCIFQCSIAHNQFFGNPGALAKLLNLHARVEEQEIIAVGDVKYDKMAYVSTQNSSKSYQDAVNHCIELLKGGIS